MQKLLAVLGLVGVGIALFAFAGSLFPDGSFLREISDGIGSVVRAIGESIAQAVRGVA